MREIVVSGFADWRRESRLLLLGAVHPDHVRFTDGVQSSLFASVLSVSEVPEPVPAPPGMPVHSVPREFLNIAELAAMHREPERWNLLYRALFRMTKGGERHLLKVTVDADVAKLLSMEKAVSRDIHKMHAFVRFRRVDTAGGGEQYIAWHKPDHHVLEHVGPWFAERFGAMHWAILTPDRSAYWDTSTLRFGPGVPKNESPQSDELEDLWRSYYASIFNPARVNVRAMTREMPVRHWSTLPEATLIPRLVSDAGGRERAMRAARPTSAEPFVPSGASLPVLAEAVRKCEGCELYRHATQPVFGAGPATARVMLVGEQPGDQEDLQGSPFVGPAGQVLDEALREAGVVRSSVYVTNAVKHFKFEERGKRRIHKKPSGAEVAACRPWLSSEIAQVNPEVIVALGATAALSIGGREFAIQKERGNFVPLANGRALLVTVHPSFLLRLPEAARPEEFAKFVRDLRMVA